MTIRTCRSITAPARRQAASGRGMVQASPGRLLSAIGTGHPARLRPMALHTSNDHPHGGLRVSSTARKTVMYHPLDSKRCSMQSHLPPSSSSRRIDEDWLQQWIAFGMLDMAIYLTKHARFAAYLAHRDQRTKRPARAKER
jgi:hypothetical protein